MTVAVVVNCCKSALLLNKYVALISQCLCESSFIQCISISLLIDVSNIEAYLSIFVDLNIAEGLLEGVAAEYIVQVKLGCSDLEAITMSGILFITIECEAVSLEGRLYPVNVCVNRSFFELLVFIFTK